MIHNNMDLLHILLPIEESLTQATHREILETADLLCEHMEDATKSFSQKHLSRFDPSVGDEACQIRAFMILKAYNEISPPEIEMAQEKIRELKASIARITEIFATHHGELLSTQNEVNRDLEPIQEAKKKITISCKEQFAQFSKKEIAQRCRSALEPITQKEHTIRAPLLMKEKEIAQLHNNLLHKIHLYILDERLHVLVYSYIITKVKVSEIDRTSDIHRIRDKTNVRQLTLGRTEVNTKLMTSVVNIAKRMLNHLSIQFLQREADVLVSKKQQIFKSMMAKELPSAKKGLKEVSFYHNCVLIVKQAQRLGIPLLLKSRSPNDLTFNESGQQLFSDLQLYRVNPSHKRYQPSENMGLSDETVLVIEGIRASPGQTSLQEALESSGGPLKVLKMCAAQHRFCTGQKAADPRILLDKDNHDLIEPEIKKILDYDKAALEQGYHHDNYTSFLIEHIYADVFKHQVDNPEGH